jgi:hypothetical protein
MSNPNSKDAADRGFAYKRIERPDNPVDAIDAIDVWARYFHRAVRVHNEFHKIEANTRNVAAAGVATTHLDPPPEPFST